MSDDPMRQSGFTGGSERWRREREPILEGFQNSGDLLDVCCANGHLVECLTRWGQARGLEITPFGIDQGSQLIELARRRFPRFADHFQVANAWNWYPPRQYRYVYALWDCVPENYLPEFIRRLLVRSVAPGGRLILGAYGSLSRHEQPFDVEMFLRSVGYQVSGTAWGGAPPIARFSWVNRDSVSDAQLLQA
jgi:SAM-dependent methyltransferase